MSHELPEGEANQVVTRTSVFGDLTQIVNIVKNISFGTKESIVVGSSAGVSFGVVYALYGIFKPPPPPSQQAITYNIFYTVNIPNVN